MKINKKFVFGLAIVALFGTITNYVYFSPLLALLLPLIIFVVNKKRLRRPVFWLYIFFLAFVISAVLYDPHSVIDFGFYRRDGNFIISYAPLMVLPLFTFSQDIKKYLRYFYLFALSVYGVLFVFYLLKLNIHAGIQQVVFGGLFIAQNAVGGFLSILAGLGFAYAWHKDAKKEWLFFGIIFVVLLATYSRGSIVGLVMGLGAWYLAKNRYFKTLLCYLMIPVLFTVGALMIGYPYYKHKLATHNYAYEYTGQGTAIKNANILIRVLYTFPRAYYSFTKSPIVGTGVGSFDDRPYQFKEIVPYVEYNAQPHKVHTDSHAHHSYLQFLAEQGIVGLALFLTFWVSLFWYLLRLDDRPIIRDFLLIAFFTLTFAGFTEHRLTTPSNMLPFTIPLGLIIAQTKQAKSYWIKKVKPA